MFGVILIFVFFFFMIMALAPVDPRGEMDGVGCVVFLIWVVIMGSFVVWFIS